MSWLDAAAEKLRKKTWAAFARERGGEVLDSPGPAATGYVLDVPCGDALVRIDVHHELFVGPPTLRARARFLLGRGPEFFVEADPDAPSTARMTFDAAFHVRTAHVRGVRIVWTDRAQELLLSLFPEGRASSDGKIATATVRPFPMSARALAIVCDLAAELARYGERFMEPLRAVEGAIWVPPEGPFEERSYPFVRVVRGGAEVEIHPERRKKKLAIGARTALARALPEFELALTTEGISPEPPAGVFAPESIELVRAIAPATLSCDGTALRLALDGEADTARLTALATFLASISGRAKTSVFR
jgi:hypothetical protein